MEIDCSGVEWIKSKYRRFKSCVDAQRVKMESMTGYFPLDRM